MLCYKFRSFDQRALEILINRELYFAGPHTLNDPLDNQLDIEREYELAQVPLIHIENVEDRFRQFFLLNQLNAARFTHKDGGRINFNQLIQRYIASVGILSLTKNATDALLWSHYAAGHTGVAIGIETSMLSRDEIIDEDDVIYTNEPPYAKVFSELLERAGEFIKPWEDAGSVPDGYEQKADAFYTKQVGLMVRANRYTKSEKWRYEEERRIVRRIPGFNQFPAAAVMEIVFGQRASKNDERTIFNLMSGHEWQHVKFFRATAIPGTFNLSLVRAYPDESPRAREQ